jgi:autotransporter adhesin
MTHDVMCKAAGMIALAMATAATLERPAEAQTTCTLASAEPIGPTQASGTGSFACGPNAAATQARSTALGSAASASAPDSTAVGRAASATGANSVALGQGSVANQANTVSVGAAGAERRIVNVGAGTAATDAVNLGQLNAALAGTTTNVAGLQSQVDDLFAGRLGDRRDAQRGIAAAVAMSAAPMPSEPGRISYTLNGAIYRGEQAIGGSMMYRLNTSKPMAFGAGISHAGGGSTAVRVGVAGEF